MSGFIENLRRGPQASRRLKAVSCVLFALGASAAVIAADNKVVDIQNVHSAQDVKTSDRVTMNFQAVDIAAAAKAVGLILKKNFIIDPRVNGTIDILSSQPVPRDLVYPIFLSALRVRGFTIVEATGVSKILPEADAKLNDNHISKGGQGDQIITQVISLQYENAAQLVPVLRPLISPNNIVNAYPNTNTLVITDYAENMARLLKIVASIDVPPAGEIQIIKLNFASALDISAMLAKLMPEIATSGAVAPGQANPKTLLSVDPRTNSLLVRSDNASTLHKVRQFVDQLDTPAAGNGNIHVVYLRNAEAVKVAEALRGILTGDSGRSSSSGNNMPGGSLTPSNSTGATGQAASPATAPLAPSNTQSVSFALPANQGGGVVEAYPSTNSLVIVAPDHIYNNLRAVIDKLDARRAQVFVEAVIVEVTETKANSFGVQWQTLSGVTGNKIQAIGGTNFSNGGSNIISASGNLTSVGQGLNLGVVKGTITLPNGTTLYNIGSLVQALQSDTDANILSTPNILTIDNEEAKIVVGQNVPFITGSQTSTVGGLSNPFQTIERKDVGLTLRVKPTIAEGGTVKLTIYQEVSSVSDSTYAAGIITNKRSIESTILVDDGQIIVLGGLIQDSLNNTSNSVPILGSLPVIGTLFRSDNRTREKTNLMVFMRPVVMRDSKAPMALTQDRYDFIRNEQLHLQPFDHPFLPAESGAVLPDSPLPH